MTAILLLACYRKASHMIIQMSMDSES
jgi:hypothetical protein